MCGICGVVQLRGEPRPVIAPEALDWMTDSMSHRGPNDRGTYLSDGIALGVRRLSVVDVAAGHQPFSNEDARVWAVQNGELYNHNEIRSRLSALGHRFNSRCDTEILPHLYEDVGTELPKQLRGMFGLAVWDERTRTTLIARDRLGIKPLYYAEADDVVVFGSELKSVLASGLVPTDLDYEAIDSFLTLGFVPGPLTPLKAVKKLMPGHVLIVDPRGVRVEQYWAYPKPNPAEVSLEEASGQLLEGLEESVRMRLMADVPLGAMLSGGLDSSVIVALMARQMSDPVKTFSIGFAEAGEGNELADAKLVARVLRYRSSRARALVRRGHCRSRRARLAHGRAAGRPLVARLPRTLRAGRDQGDGRALGPGCRRADGRLPEAQGGGDRRSLAQAARLRADGRQRAPHPWSCPARPCVADAGGGRRGRAPPLDERQPLARAPTAACSRPASPSSTDSPGCGLSARASTA